MYQPLINQIEYARIRSAIFYKVDLHVHTYESTDDFPKLGDKPGCVEKLCEMDKLSVNSYFIEAGKKAKLRMMAITDHNRSRVAEQLAALSDNDLLVLPGMEVSIKTNFFTDSVIHLLTIFPEKYTAADIDKVFAKGNMPIYAERKNDSVVELSVSDFIKAVHLENGICIASHVNSNKGIRTLFRESNMKLLKIEYRKRELQKRKDKGTISPTEEAELIKIKADYRSLDDDIQNQLLLFLAEHQFDAIEIQCSGHRQYYAGDHVDNLGIRPIPCVMGSDAHNLSDIGLSSYSTYVKMTTPSFTDLKKALRDPGTRIRFENDIHRLPISKILGVQFDGGYFHNHTIGFSDNLTCLIGGRGSGKSATIETLRYIFNIKPTHASNDKLKDINDRLDHTLTNTQIKVAFIDEARDIYVLKRRYNETATECYDIHGSLHGDLDINAASNLKVKIYGWGEIEELARSKREQLNLIDGFIEKIDNAKDEVNDQMRELMSNTSSVIALASDIDLLLPRIVELPTKVELLRKLNSPELDATFTDFDRNQIGQSAILSIHNTINERKKLFLQTDGKTYQIEDNIIKTLTDISDKLRSYDWYEAFEGQIRSLASDLQRGYQELLDSFDNLIQLVTSTNQNLEGDEKRIEADLNRVAEETEDPDAKSLLSRRKALTEEVSILQLHKDLIDNKHKELLELLSDRESRIVPSLNKARREITRLRRIKLREINQRLTDLTSTAKVEISLLHQKERISFTTALGTGDKAEGILKKVNRHYIADRYAEHYSRRHSPHTFVKSIIDNDDTECRKLRIFQELEDGTRNEIISKNRAMDVKKHLSPYLEESQHFDPKKLQKLLELEHCDTEDLVRICLDGRLIEELSPGQRCCALIPVILLESQCPLIIDQPEDNLDNKLVFNLVVDIIRGLKERRQIIVATHNPNIPVSGDAEQIIVFDARSKEHCETITSGSIDCDDIVEHVKAIMEGSEEAFRIRAVKYGYEIPVRSGHKRSANK